MHQKKAIIEYKGEALSSKLQPNTSDKKSSKKINKNIRKILQKHIYEDMQNREDPYILDSSFLVGWLMLNDLILEDANKYLPLAMEQKDLEKESKDT